MNSDIGKRNKMKAYKQSLVNNDVCLSMMNTKCSTHYLMELPSKQWCQYRDQSVLLIGTTLECNELLHTNIVYIKSIRKTIFLLYQMVKLFILMRLIYHR